jgi:hypothetical protein
MTNDEPFSILTARLRISQGFMPGIDRVIFPRPELLQAATLMRANGKQTM